MKLVSEYMGGVEYARSLLAGDIRQERLERRMAEQLAAITASTQAKAEAIVSASRRPDAMEKLILEAAGNTGVADAAMSVPIALMAPRNPLADAISKFAGITPPRDSACIGSGAHIKWIKVWRVNECDTMFFAEGVDENGNPIRSVDASMRELRDALTGQPVAGGCVVGERAACVAQTVERARALAQHLI